MKLITPSLNIEHQDGFKNDILDREYFGERLLNLVSNTNDPLVISLDGKWGEGKTTFVKMWQGMLKDSNIHSIYFDAFANDYLDDAFISIISAVTSYAEENTENDNLETVNELKDKAKNVGVKLLGWTAKLGVKAATLGAIKDSDIEELKTIQNDLSNGASNFIGKAIEERITSHDNDIKLITSFRETLSETPKRLNNSEGKSLVIIIDELDRCKPSFAIEIIEKIKHLFSVENIIFVLVMNKGQLEESIKSVYGNIDAHTYLQKFITLETTLPKNTESLHDTDFSKYSNHLLKQHDIETWGDEENLLKGIIALAEHFMLSLRQLEKVFTNLAIFYGSSDESQLRLTPIIAFLSVIKVVNPEIFQKIKNNKLHFEDLCEEIGFKQLDKQNRDQRILYFIKLWLKRAMLSEAEFEALDEDDITKAFDEYLRTHDLHRENLIPFFVNTLSMFKRN